MLQFFNQFPFSFSSKSRLDLHNKYIHKNLNFFVCKFCGKNFKTRSLFELHVAKHQGVYRQPAQCTVCSAWLRSDYGLKLHMKRNHTDEKPSPLPCDICGTVLANKDRLREHIKNIHETKKNWHCNYCDKSFKHQRNLTVSIRLKNDYSEIWLKLRFSKNIFQFKD